MCGRFTIAVNKEDLAEHLYRQFGIEDFGIDYLLPRYNIAPGEKIITVISDGNKYRAGLMRWGFVPPYSGNLKIINARRETLLEKPAFKNAFLNRRCLVLSDGYYEWKKEGNKKIPHRITLKERKLFAFAGIWNFASEEGNRIATCAIITGAAGPAMGRIHDRVPAVLKPEAEKLWLAPGFEDPEALLRLTAPLKDEDFRIYPVSPVVNDSRKDSEACIIPIEQKK